MYRSRPLTRALLHTALASAIIVGGTVTAAAAAPAPEAPRPAVVAVADQPATTPAAPADFRIMNRLSGKCLIPWGSGDGTVVTQVVCDAGNIHQWWRLDLSGVGPITNRGTGRCLDLWGNNNADGQIVYTWACVGVNSQRWKTVDRGGQYYELRPYYTNKCLDLAANSHTDGAVIQQWGCHLGANNNQQWWLG